MVEIPTYCVGPTEFVGLGEADYLRGRVFARALQLTHGHGIRRAVASQFTHLTKSESCSPLQIQIGQFSGISIVSMCAPFLKGGVSKERVGAMLANWCIAACRTLAFRL